MSGLEKTRRAVLAGIPEEGWNRMDAYRFARDSGYHITEVLAAIRTLMDRGKLRRVGTGPKEKWTR